MDLFTLAAKITLDDSSYTSGINNAEKMGQQLGSKLSAMTVAVGQITADVIRQTASAIGGVLKGAVDGYADYQQLVGGVETLFKTSAKKVQKYAQESYKTTGLSANDYMETVTSFSASLLQGLGGDTEKAADMANTAIIDMADNANKMGTDIGSIQVAYQGFAKKNFTMLDNLKLGYGGTASEMIRLINDSKILDHEITSLDDITFDQLVQAIHEVQTEMGITGTTAKEAAETISGSKASLEAAWTDFLVAIGGEADQDKLKGASKRFQQAFETYVGSNLAPQVQTTIENSPELIEAVSTAITNLPSSAISDLVNSGLDLLTATVDGATKIGGWLVDGLIGLFKDVNADPSKIAELGNAVGTFIGSALSDIVTNAPTVISGLFTAGVTLAGSIIEGLFAGLFGVESPLDEVGEEMEDSIIQANINAEKSKSVLDYMEQLVEKFGTGATNTKEFKEAQEELERYMGEKAGKVFLTYGSDVQGAIDKLRELSKEMRKTAILDAMRQSVNAQYEILGKTGADIELSKFRRDSAQSLIDNYPQILKANLAAYAQELKTQVEEANNDFVSNLVDVNALEGFINGTAAEEMGIGSMFKQLSDFYDLLNEIYIGKGTDESDTLWGKNRADEIYSYDEISDQIVDVEKAQDTVTTETKKLAELQTQYDEVQQSINDSEKALEKTVQGILENAGYAADGISDGGEDVASAIVGVSGLIRRAGASLLSSVQSRVSAGLKQFQDAVSANTLNINSGSKGGWQFSASDDADDLDWSDVMPRAVGLDYVPFTGFKASLHRGEAIVTASENAERRNGNGSAEVVGAIQEMRADLQNLRLVVGQKAFGRAVVDYGGRQTRDYIGQAESREYSGYGT